MPLKLITLVRSEDLAAWRRDLVARAAAGVPGLVRLLYNTVLPVDVRPVEGVAPARWDAVVEAWFDTQAAREGWAASLPDAEILANFAVEQKLVHDSGIRPLPAKVIVTFRRRAGKTRAEAQAHWRGRHVEVGLVEHNATDFLRLYFQNHVAADNRVEWPEFDYDGLPEFWLDPDALANVGPDSEVMRAIAQDEENFADRTSLVTLLVAEEELFVREGAMAGWEAL